MFFVIFLLIARQRLAATDYMHLVCVGMSQQDTMCNVYLGMIYLVLPSPCIFAGKKKKI